MKAWTWLNVLILLSVIPVVFLFPGAAGPVMAAGGGSTVIRILVADSRNKKK